MYSVEVLSKDEDRISVRLNGFPIQYANALRRICLNGVPIFAVDTVEIVENGSVLADEGLAHRLALVPLTTPRDTFNTIDKCGCGREEGCANCRVMLILDSGKSTETATLTTSRLSSEDPAVRPISDQVPIVDLAPAQKVVVECYARLGRGTEHAKWNSANVSVLTGNEEEGLVLTVESTGAMKPEDIILAGVDELANRLAELRDAVQGEIPVTAAQS